MIRPVSKTITLEIEDQDHERKCISRLYTWHGGLSNVLQLQPIL